MRVHADGGRRRRGGGRRRAGLPCRALPRRRTSGAGGASARRGRGARAGVGRLPPVLRRRTRDQAMAALGGRRHLREPRALDAGSRGVSPDRARHARGRRARREARALARPASAPRPARGAAWRAGARTLRLHARGDRSSGLAAFFEPFEPGGLVAGLGQEGASLHHFVLPEAGDLRQEALALRIREAHPSSGVFAPSMR